MTSFQKPTIKIIENFTDMKPFKCLEYPNQVSKIIWEINSNNILQSSTEIIDYIKSNKISVQLTLHLISAVSEIRIKEISLFAEVYQKILNEFACMIIPTNKRLAALLFYKDVNFPNYKPKYDLESLINIFSKESPLYYIAWDKVDELKSRYPNLNVNMKIRNDYVPTQPFTFIDCACRFGSELCFNYLKNSGAEYTEYTPWYAIQGGNENIISQMIDEGITFDDLIQAALECHHFEIADYLNSNLEQVPISVEGNLYFGNFGVASYLLANGADLSDRAFLLFVVFIIVF